jgi:hypothetical protein
VHLLASSRPFSETFSDIFFEDSGGHCVSMI